MLIAHYKVCPLGLISVLMCYYIKVDDVEVEVCPTLKTEVLNESYAAVGESPALTTKDPIDTIHEGRFCGLFYFAIIKRIPPNYHLPAIDPFV